MSEAQSIAQNLEKVMDLVHKAAQRSGRDDSEVMLVGVTKTHPADVVLEALEAGIVNVGENRPEELEAKRIEVGQRLPSGSPRPVWHMIGHIQSRKAGRVASAADMVHSVDTEKLANRLASAAAEEGRVIPVLLEVNLSGEESKYGFAADRWQEDRQWNELCRAVEAILDMSNLQLQGLMTMAPWVEDSGLIRSVFRSARRLMEKLAAAFPGGEWRHLSMGMTDDYEIAIEEGATTIRVGRAIFGSRNV